MPPELAYYNNELNYDEKLLHAYHISGHRWTTASGTSPENLDEHTESDILNDRGDLGTNSRPHDIYDNNTLATSLRMRLLDVAWDHENENTDTYQQHDRA